MNNPNRITSDDFLTSYFNYKIIHSKISNLIELGEINAEYSISSLKFKPIDLKESFFDSVQILQLTNKDIPRTIIKNLLQELEKLIDVNPSNPNSINYTDILGDSLDYRNIYDKISNLINDNHIGGRDSIARLIFEPESLRSEFYSKIKDLNLTNYKKYSQTKIGTLLKRLEDKIVEKSIDGISIDDNTIRKEDVLGKGLDCKTIYIKISNFIKYNSIGPNDRLSSLIFESQNLKDVFYHKIKDLNLTGYKEVGKTPIQNFKKTLTSEIVKTKI